MLITILLCLVITSNLKAQDAQFSQLFAAPLHLNPALAGNGGVSRAGMSTRYQWPSLDRRFVSSTIFYDHFIKSMSGGFGVVFNNHFEERSNYRSSEFGFLYAHQLKLKGRFSLPKSREKQLFVRMGTQFSLFNQNAGTGNLIFGDQLDLSNPNVISPTLENLNSGFEDNWFLSLAAGIMIYNEQGYVGFSAHHLNEPNQSFFEELVTVPLERKYSIQTGIKADINWEMIRWRPRNLNRIQGYYERSIALFANYRWQGEFRQLDVGVQLVQEPVILGLSYRGIPIQSVSDVLNNDALVGLLGMKFPSGHTFGYSYDLTTSRLAGASGGSHELTYTYFFGRPKERHKRMRCPVAQR